MAPPPLCRSIYLFIFGHFVVHTQFDVIDVKDATNEERLIETENEKESQFESKGRIIVVS